MELKQHEMVLKYLKTHKKITSREAFELFGIMQMPKRIWILKKLGHKIHTEMKRGKNRFGSDVTYAEYSLVR